MPALIIGANLPDVDAACFFWLEGVEHLGFRRGITHGPPALVLLPLILAGLLYGFDRWQAKRGKRPEDRLPVNFKWLFLLSFIGCLTHPALDWLNVYGIRLLEPFSSQWFYGDTLFIIDVWLWALMGFATWFSLRREKRSGEWKQPARVAIAAALAYIGLNTFISHEATQIEHPVYAFEENIASPLPLTFWKREVIVPANRELFNGWATRIYDPFSPTAWSKPDDFPVEPCLGPLEVAERYSGNTQVHAFMKWARVPFVELRDGNAILRDARFYDPRARDNFSVALPLGDMRTDCILE